MYTRPKTTLKPVVIEVSVPLMGMKRPVSAEIALKMKGIAEWDLSFLRHRPEFLPMSQGDFDRGILEVKRYHAIGVIDVTYVHAVAARVDPFWHEHIHFSVDYQAFCDRFVGHYKEHFPIDEALPGVRDQIMPCYRRTLQMYSDFFGEPDPTWWGPPGSDGGPVCLDVNHFMGRYHNGYYSPLDWSSIITSTKSYDALVREIEEHEPRRQT